MPFTENAFLFEPLPLGYGPAPSVSCCDPKLDPVQVPRGKRVVGQRTGCLRGDASSLIFRADPIPNFRSLVDTVDVNCRGLALSRFPFAPCQRPQDGIENAIEVRAQILGEETQHEITVFL